MIRTTEVIVCGYRPGQGRITGMMGGLLLGAHDPDTGDLLYIGDVGTGFSEADRADLQTRLDELPRRTHPFAVAPPREDVARARWVEPILVGEVVYRQFTRSGGRLRHTAWRGLRADRTADEVLIPHREPGVDTTAPTPAAPSAGAAPAGAGAAQDPAVPLGPRITVQAGNRRLTLSTWARSSTPPASPRVR